MPAILGGVIREPATKNASNNAYLRGLPLLFIDPDNDLELNRLAITNDGLDRPEYRRVKRHNRTLREQCLSINHPIINI